jgi:ABC-type lipoprotein release transport system permease subunit
LRVYKGAGDLFNPTTFLALRYLFVKNKNNFLFLATRLTFLGIVVASCALALSLMITSGFERSVKKTLRALSSDIVIMPQNKIIDEAFVSTLAKDQKLGILKNFCPVAINQLIIDQNEHYQTVTFQGVLPAAFSMVTDVADKLKAAPKGFDFAKNLKRDNVIIGEKLATTLGLKIGGELAVLVPIIKGRKVTLCEKKVTIAATINTGFDEYDRSLLIGSHVLYQRLFGKLKNYDCVMARVGEKISFTPYAIDKKKFFLERLSLWSPLEFIDPTWTAAERLKIFYSGHRVLHWTELSPNLLASMKLEKFVINLVILLILFVGLISMVSLVYMNIQTKRRDIAILMTLGMSTEQIKDVFVKMGLFISVFATIFGEAVAYLAGIFLQRYDFIKLPDVYYVQQIPVNLNFGILFFVFILTNLAVYFACKMPVSGINKMSVAGVLRN